MAIEQDLSSGNYGAVVSITAAGMAKPKRDYTNNQLTALMDVVTIADQTGLAIGTAANPLVITGGTGPTAGLTAKGYQQVAATAALTSLTVPAGSTVAIVSTKGNDARYRDDGPAPTTTVGMPIYSGATMTFTTALAALKFIASANTTEYNISYYG